MSDAKLDLTAKIEDDHAELKRCMTALAEQTAWDDVPETFTSWKLELLWQLRDFQNRLLKHFDLEEEGGFMADLVRLAPRYARRVEHLEEEHRKIVSDLNHLLAELKRASSMTASQWERVRARIDELFALIRAHEATEYELMQKAYYQDYGVGD